MPESVSLLTREFLTWVASRRRTYAEAMEAWRSSCPRLTAGEDALLGGLIEIASGGPLPHAEVTLTATGRAVLDDNLTPDAASTGRRATAHPGVAAGRPRA